MLNQEDKFEEALQEEHSKQHPQVLDDDLPDHFDNWVSNLAEEEKEEIYKKFIFVKELKASVKTQVDKMANDWLREDLGNLLKKARASQLFTLRELAWLLTENFEESDIEVLKTML